MLGREGFSEVAFAFSLVDGESLVLDPATDDEGNEVASVISSRRIR